jgi:hypothetical protein
MQIRAVACLPETGCTSDVPFRILGDLPTSTIHLQLDHRPARAPADPFLQLENPAQLLRSLGIWTLGIPSGSSEARATDLVNACNAGVPAFMNLMPGAANFQIVWPSTFKVFTAAAESVSVWIAPGPPTTLTLSNACVLAKQVTRCKQTRQTDNSLPSE